MNQAEIWKSERKAKELTGRTCAESGVSKKGGALLKSCEQKEKEGEEVVDKLQRLDEGEI